MKETRIMQFIIMVAACVGILAVVLASHRGDTERRETAHRAEIAAAVQAVEARNVAQREAAARAVAWAVATTAERFAAFADIGPRDHVGAICIPEPSVDDRIRVLCNTTNTPNDRAWNAVVAWSMSCPIGGNGSPCVVTRSSGYSNAWGASQ